jgi:hypothetical protein
MEQELNRKYHLSTDGYYFKYRPDKYNPEALRADLFDSKDNKVDSLRVKSNDITSIGVYVKPHGK